VRRSERIFARVGGLPHKPCDLFVDLGGFGFTVIFALRKTFREKHRLAGTLIAHQSQLIAHAIFRDHGPGDIRCPLQIVWAPVEISSKTSSSANPSAQKNGQPVQQFRAGH
jgi:hypothetical protein